MTRLISFTFALLLLISGVACKKPAEISDVTWNEYAKPVINKAGLYDTLPALATHNISVKEIKGIKVDYASGKSTSYFEYETDQQELINAISALPFKKGNAINDTLCRKIDIPFSLSGGKVLSKEELAEVNFFWSIIPNDYTYYECIKYPARHTLLINKATRKVLHRIEVQS